jgi:hypothetical protein
MACSFVIFAIWRLATSSRDRREEMQEASQFRARSVTGQLLTEVRVPRLDEPRDFIVRELHPDSLSE